jgi:hypothetical protein
MQRSEVGAGDLATSAASSRRASRAERVLEALNHHARNGIVCELPSLLARWLGISVDTVQRGIADLLGAGQIERTPMRSGKATAYRIVESPQADDASPQPSAASLTNAARPPKGGAALQSEDRSKTPDLFEAGLRETPRSRWNQSPMEQADRAWMLAPWDEGRFEWPEYASARREFERFCWGAEVPQDALLQKAEVGECADCFVVGTRLRFGSFELCRRCVARRVSAHLRVAVEIASIPNERDELRPLSTPIEVRWIAA